MGGTGRLHWVCTMPLLVTDTNLHGPRLGAVNGLTTMLAGALRFCLNLLQEWENNNPSLSWYINQARAFLKSGEVRRQQAAIIGEVRRLQLCHECLLLSSVPSVNSVPWS